MKWAQCDKTQYNPILRQEVCNCPHYSRHVQFLGLWTAVCGSGRCGAACSVNVLEQSRIQIRAVPDGSAPVYDASRTGYITTKTEGILNHRSRIRYLSKKNSRIFDEFSETKKIRKNSYKKSLNARVGVAFQWNSLLICIISNKPTTTTEEFDAFHGFMLIKI